MARCGCTGTTCSCKLVGKGAVVVTGAGTLTNPYEISVSPAMAVQDSGTVDLTLYGSGTSTDPYILSADAALALDDITNVETAGGSTGNVLALQADGTWAPAPASTAPVGAVSTSTALDGDGSSGDPLTVRLDSLAGLEIVSGGLRVDPYTVTAEGLLDPTYGALPSGSIVSDTDGLNAWLKSDSGWKNLLEDTGNVTTLPGNIVARAGFEITAFQARRKNGIVFVSMGIKTLVSRTSGIDSGNMANIPMADLIPAHFRPAVASPMRVTSTGTDEAFYMSNGGILTWSNMAQPDYTLPAGSSWTINGTWIGA
jgi:hypothetical protein